MQVMPFLTDTHCHIHFADYPLDSEEVLERAHKAGVNRLICVGCTLEDSRAGVAFAQNHADIWASIGIHPHEGAKYAGNADALKEFTKLAIQPKVIAIGETGLDYYYDHSSKAQQAEILHFQLKLAKKLSLPLIFHVREAFSDFWNIFDEYNGLEGVIHSFSATSKELNQILDHGLYVGLNGIMTFTKNQNQLEAAKNVPLERLLLETDAPYLTPQPLRGTICEPRHVEITARFLADLRAETFENIAEITSSNASTLFNL